MSEFGFLTFTFTGRNGAGTISVPGVKAGDRVIWSTFTRSGITTYTHPGEVWDFGITVDDELQQIEAGNDSATAGEILVYRGG